MPTANELYLFHKQTILATFGINLLAMNWNIYSLDFKAAWFPYKFRFIAGAAKCFNKLFAIKISVALKCIWIFGIIVKL